MVTSINLGSFNTENGKTVLSGSASGLDTKGLIDGLSAAKRLPAVQLEDKMKSNAAQSDAYAKLKTILTDFQSVADYLRNPPGVGNQSQDAFSQRTTSVGYSGSSSGSSFVTITAAAGASISSMDITVDSLATFNTKLTNTFAVTDADTAAVGATSPFTAGTLTLGASGVAVTLVDGDTLNQVAAKINSVKQQSNVEATIIKVSDGNYRLSLKTLKTGTDQNYTLNPASSALFTMGLASDVAAVNAQITLDGTTVVTRQTNGFNDVLPDLTFSLLKKTEATEKLTVDVSADQEQLVTAITNFATTYNNFRVFVAQQTELDPNTGKPKDTAILSSSSTLRSISSRISTEIAGIVDGLAGGDPNRLADIGLNFTDFAGDTTNPATRNIIQVDDAKLRAAIASDFDSVRRVFEFDYTSDDPNISVFSRSNALGVSNVTLNINTTAGTFEATYLDNGSPKTITMDATAMSGSVAGYVLKGKVGTVLEGLTLLYTSTSDATIDLNLSQGIGDRIYNSLDSVLNTKDGMLTTEISSITDQNTRYQKEIDRIDQIVADYRNTLLQQYSTLESSISKANVLLQSLAANSAAQNGSSG